MTTENQPSETPNEIPVDIPEESPAPVAPAKKRGRPSNAEKAARESGASAAEQIESGKSGSTAKTKTASKNSRRVTAADIGSLAQQLVGLHQLGAMLSGIPEVVIDDSEGKLLAGGIIAVCEQYDLSIDGKTGAALQLLGAAAMVYAPRAFKIVAKNAAMKKARESGNQSADFEMSANGQVYPATPS